MKRVIVALTLVLYAVGTMAQQVDWNGFQRMMNEGSYKTLYKQAKEVYDNNTDPSERFAAAFWMARSSARYQEYAYDSAVVHYRALLPSLDSLHSAICYSFLHSYDTALHYEQVLKRTSADAISKYTYGNNKGFTLTPTAYDVVVRKYIVHSDVGFNKMVALQRELCTFHSGDADDLRINLDVELLEYMERCNSCGLTDDTVIRYIDKYRGTQSQYVTLLYHKMAQRRHAAGDYVAALAWCDSAIALFPKSEGGIDCANLREDILQIEFEVNGSLPEVMADRRSLQKVQYRNVDHLWFRILQYQESFVERNEMTDKKLRAIKPLKEWDLPVPTNNEYKSEESYVAMPALPVGNYLLMVSPTADFKDPGFRICRLVSTDVQLVRHATGGVIVDKRSGRPIAGQKVMRVDYRYDNHRGRREVQDTVASTVTDALGRFDFDDYYGGWGYKLLLERSGQTLTYNGYNSNSERDSSWRQNVRICMDRPIYKPGDTVHAAVVYYISNGRESMSAQFFQVTYVLVDPNGEEVLRDSIKTDSYGIADIQFTLPKDRLPGYYRLKVFNYGSLKRMELIRVEEYKQPKFMVTMDQPGNPLAGGNVEVPQFGKPYTVRGMAASYSSVPVGGATVKYTVVRNYYNRRWWLQSAYGDTEVANGEVKTAADGSFEITFVPEQATDIEGTPPSVYGFRINVDVTDINGESHPASTSLRVGLRNAFLDLEGNEDVRSLDSIKPRYFDLNGNALPTEHVNMKIERLRQPAVPLLNAPGMYTDRIHQTISEGDYRKAFPLYAYNADYNNRDKWAVAGEGIDGSGVYRITLSAPDADTVVVYRTLTAPDCRKSQSQNLLWSDIEAARVFVGDTLRLRVGTRFRNVELFYALQVEGEDFDFRRLTLNDEIRTLNIVVDSSMRGGITISLFAVRDAVVGQVRYDVDVPYRDKQLDVEIATFRDKLLPGENEEWMIKVKNEGRYVASSLVMTMFDDALNSFGNSLSWNIWPYSVFRGKSYSFERIPAYWCDSRIKSREWFVYNGETPTAVQLWEGLEYMRPYGLTRMYRKNASAIDIGAPENGVRITSDDIERMPGTQVMSIAASVGGVGYSDDEEVFTEMVVMEEEEVVEEESLGSGSRDMEGQVRTNLNTLAFFVAGLRTDSTGTATYSFTVPELLTRWSVKGLAITKDIKVGTLDRTLVTSKRLMVQPNIPRFLRSGDRLTLLAKVVTTEKWNEARDVVVAFLLTDAATGDTICYQTETVMLTDAAQVGFDVEVPQNVYVATYQITAVAEGMSDGERGQLPVVSNRQAVTVSQAMYINGVGEKHYSMPEFLRGDDSREPRLLAAEVTSDPIWLAIKCMPYLQSSENPSTLYIANQLYINNMGRRILDKVDLSGYIENVDSLAKSRLSINEDVKQTLQQATPWVRDAESEEEQMRAVANFFDPAELGRNLEKATKELQQRQNADGGWSWMPESRSSVWVTQQVLKKIDGSRFNVDAALEYIDNEHQKDYEKYIKPSLKRWPRCGVTDIDYLYTRSFYGKGKTEAYRYYYSSAKKNYKKYENLYTQAQLALIFYRHGDRKQAIDLLRRIKEKSLESDEMGLYWRDNRSGWFWYQRPIETQALLIQAFAEITPSDTNAIGQMQQWLLKQKQTTHWGNDEATTKAIAALMVTPSGTAVSTDNTNTTSILVFGDSISAEATVQEGYRAQRWTDGALDTLRSNASSDIVFRKSTKGIAWGTVYYQFADDMDKIPSSEMGIKISRSYHLSGTSATEGTALPAETFKVGDRVRVRIEISCDRAMEYLELVDGRPSCTEPLSTRAGWRWTNGLSYYITVNNTDTRCYIEHIDKGNYVFEYEVYITNPGSFLCGPVTMQCMYAPEFRAVAPAQRLTVE